MKRKPHKTVRKSLWLAMLVVFVFAPVRGDAFTSGTSDVQIGVHLMLDDGRNRWPPEIWPQHIAYAAEIVDSGGPVVQVIRSDDLDPARWQVFMDLCAEHNLRPILRLATQFDHENGLWQPPERDPDGSYQTLAARYVTFIEALEWPTAEKWVILLNEPNNGHEWGGQPDPAAYARFIMDVSGALHETIPGIVLLNGALDLYAPDTGTYIFADGLAYIAAFRFLDEMIAAEPDVFTLIDIWNSHAYPLGAFRAPPWEQVYHFDTINDAQSDATPPPDDIYNRGINGYAWELWRLSTYGIAPLPVMITETGWRHSGGLPDASDAADDYPSPATAATYLDMALRGNDGTYPDAPQSGWTAWLNDERLVGVVLFALNGVPEEWSHTNLLKMTPAGAISSTTPLFDVVANLQKPRDIADH